MPINNKKNKRKYKSVEKKILQVLGFDPIKYLGQINEEKKIVTAESGRAYYWFQRIDTIVGKENEETILVLKTNSKLTEKNPFIKLLPFRRTVFNYVFYYPFGVKGRESLRKILKK